MCISRFLLVVAVVLFIPIQTNALDVIPDNLSGWTERGIVLQGNTGTAWEEKGDIGLAGVSKVGGTYYMHYVSGFDGCWNSAADVNHQSLGLATSTNGINFTKHSGNPVLKPHNFVPVSSHEEGIRTGYIHYLPSKGKFYGYFGVESPGGSQTCNFGGGGQCGCNIEVDARVFLATSVNGTNWNVVGPVSGSYAQSGHEVYASGWVTNGSTFGLYITKAQGGKNKHASIGSNPLSLSQLGTVSALSWGHAGLDAYLHDDNNTITLIYNPQGGTHPGTSNDYTYFATTHLNDMTTIQNERVVDSTGEFQNKIFRDGNEWKWYYSEDPGWGNHTIRLRTHPISGGGDNQAPAAPQNLQGTPLQ